MESDLPGRTESPDGLWALQGWAGDPWSLHLVDFGGVSADVVFGADALGDVYHFIIC